MSSASETATEMAQFVERKQCISCGSTELDSIWSSSFADSFVQENLAQDFYSGDALKKIPDAPIERVRCASCQQTFHKYILSEQWLQVLYSDWIDDRQIEQFESGLEISQSSEEGRQLLKHALRIKALLGSDLSVQDSLLDFGSGDGGFLAAANLLGFECYGIDFSSTREDRARRGGMLTLPSLPAYKELGNPPLKAVTLFEVLEHVAEPRGILEDLHSLLQPGGILLVEVPDCSNIETPDSREQFHHVHPLEHINNFTPKTLEAFCKNVGFTPAKRVPAHITTSPLELLKTEVSRFVNKPRTSQYFRRD